MGLSIYLENEKGEALAEIMDSNNVLHRLLPSAEDKSSLCLRFIDWYGDTIFNRLQMDTFLDELERISGQAVKSEEKDLLAGIKNLAQRCKKEPHLYLKFYGD